MSNMHRYGYIDAKISNFIQRKLAGIDQRGDVITPKADMPEIIHYEARPLPSTVTEG